MFSKFGVSWVTSLHHFGVHLRVRNGLGTKMAPESIQLRKGTTPGVESYFHFLLFGPFLEDILPKCVFVSMCLAGVVLYRICLDSWTPRTPIIRLKRCRVVQNQGFANLGKVRKSGPPDVHFDVIVETFGRQRVPF